MPEKEKKKLCIFITRMISGGAQKVVIELLRGLDREKFEISILVGNTPENEPHLFSDIPEDIKLFRFNCVVREINPQKDLAAFLKLFFFFRKEKFDILHLHTSKAGVLGAIAGRLAGIKKIFYTPHGHIFHKKAAIPGVSELPPLKMKILRFLRIISYKLCDKLVALSDEDKNEQAALRLAPLNKFCVIMNGIDVNSFEKPDKKISCGIDIKASKIIGSVGRLSKEKGHDILIKAMPGIIKEAPDTALMIVGDGQEMRELTELAKELDVEGKVLFAGNTGDVRPYLWNMDIFVLPSRYESQGIAAMEAMAAGLPVVASKVGGIPGILDDGKEGIFAEPENPDSFSSSILKLLENDALRKEFAKNTKSRAKRDFSVSTMLSSYEKLYEGELK
jgi:glycosyltransferase involved in cell wall biosynthesis